MQSARTIRHRCGLFACCLSFFFLSLMRPSLRIAILVSIPVIVVVLMVRTFFPANGQAVLPQGPQVMTGVLRSAPLSLARRGTHLLRTNSGDVAYVESTSALLRSFEGLEVTVHGVFEPNSDPSALPVIVASDVTLVQPPSRLWTVASLSLSFEAPLSWEGNVFDDGMKMVAAGVVGPVLLIYKTGSAQLPAGTVFQVGGHRASFVREAESDTVFVQNLQEVIAFSFDSSTARDSLILPPQHLLLLRSVRFSGLNVSSAQGRSATPSASVGTGTLGAPCGGSAGVLCPEGSYCEITDRAEGIGQCRTLR